MKWSTLCIVVLLCFALAGQAGAQTGAAYFTGNTALASSSTSAAAAPESAASPFQSTADPAMPMEEIARRLIQKRIQGIPDSYPTARVTINSLQVIPQGTDNYVVNATYTMRVYYKARTHVLDYDHHFLLLKQAGRWKLHSSSFSHLGDSRDDAQSTPPPAEETEVPAPGDATTASSPTPAVAQPIRYTTPPAQPQPAAANGRKYKVGQRVEYHYDGKWFKAIITKVRDNDRYQYRIHPLGYEDTMDTWVPEEESWIRSAGSGPTEPVPGGEANDPTLKAMRGTTAAAPAQPASGGGAVPARPYHCVFFVGDHLEDAAPFTITGNGTYTDSEGKRGTYSLNSSTLTFHGGNYDGQRAEYETKGGQPQLHILGPSGRRVIDCD
jgi:guanyl-specific ribonuclease Sa